MLLKGQAKQWVTPQQQHDGAAGPGSAGRIGRYGTKHGGRDLVDQSQAWQTPSAQTYSKRRQVGQENREELLLPEQAKAWATPTERDWRSENPDQSPDHSPPLGRQVLQETGPASPSGSGRHSPESRKIDSDWRNLSPQDVEDAKRTRLLRRRLNPAFVEWLMGLPLGWTACAPLETELFRWWLHTHSDVLRRL
jgi:hypothetical protein